MEGKAVHRLRFFLFFHLVCRYLPVMVAAYTVGLLLEAARGNGEFDVKWIWLSFVLIAVLIFLRFLFDYLRAKFQETISYELVARERLAIERTDSETGFSGLFSAGSNR